MSTPIVCPRADFCRTSPELLFYLCVRGIFECVRRIFHDSLGLQRLLHGCATCCRLCVSAGSSLPKIADLTFCPLAASDASARIVLTAQNSLNHVRLLTLDLQPALSVTEVSA